MQNFPIFIPLYIHDLLDIDLEAMITNAMHDKNILIEPSSQLPHAVYNLDKHETELVYNMMRYCANFLTLYRKNKENVDYKKKYEELKKSIETLRKTINE